MHAKFDANNLAYTSDSLPLHVDLPYYDYVPGVSDNNRDTEITFGDGRGLLVSVVVVTTAEEERKFKVFRA